MARIHEYIEERNGGLYVAGTRISLDSVVYSFREGKSPKETQEDFPLLELWEVYGALAYYLEHRAEVDEYLREMERKWDEAEAGGIPLKEANPDLWERLERAREAMATKKM